MVEYVRFVAVYIRHLPAEQLGIFFVRFIVYIKLNQCRITNGYHVIEAQQTISAVFKLHYMMTGFYF